MMTVTREAVVWTNGPPVSAADIFEILLGARCALGR